MLLRTLHLSDLERQLGERTDELTAVTSQVWAKLETATHEHEAFAGRVGRRL